VHAIIQILPYREGRRWLAAARRFRFAGLSFGGSVSWDMAKSYRGIFTPLLTPITSDESPDLPSLRRMVDHQIQHGVHGFWVMGTSAEFASFTPDERAAAASAVVEQVGGRFPVVVNVSDASTRTAIRHASVARAMGADAIAATPPYYYPHSQDELLDHYRRIRSAIDLPLFIYNIPQTVKVRVELGTAATLASEGTVAGIKDSQNDLEWFRQLTLFTRENGLEFSAFAGTRYLIDAGLLAGATGAIPSIANAFPDLAVEAYEAALARDFDRSSSREQMIMHIEALPLATAQGSRNAAILGFLKTVLYDQGIIASPDLTHPLRSFSAPERARLLDQLHDLVGVAPAGRT
jgi:4-hydroxy-tetrahydrodipicolinate synthase